MILAMSISKPDKPETAHARSIQVSSMEDR
jgi:hypothetical protein